jgi:hypothetical protein
MRNYKGVFLEVPDCPNSRLVDSWAAGVFNLEYFAIDSNKGIRRRIRVFK